jgi:hypothetical protein
MKRFIIAIFLVAFNFAIQAQTFADYTVTNGESLVFSVPSNTIFKVLNLVGNGGSYSLLYVQYPSETTNIWRKLYGSAAMANDTHTPVLGPALIKLEGMDQYLPSHLITEFDPVNITPSGSIGAAQMPGTVASVALQSSTNLTKWQNVSTNASALSSNSPVKFFRVQLQ